MKRILAIAIVLLATLPATATDRFARDPEQVPISTTGRIVKIDSKNKSFRVRGSDGQSISIRYVSQNISQMMQGLRQKTRLTLPGGITIALPGHEKKAPSKSADGAENLDDYTVVTTKDTLFQDGSDSIRFEDFKTGETISVHGVLSGNVLTATRVAKWE